MGRYIGYAPSKEQFNVNGESLGMSGERALYYSKSVGKHRIYRNSYPTIEPFIFKGKDINADLKLLIFKTSEKTQEVVDEVNEVYGDNFIVKEVNE